MGFLTPHPKHQVTIVCLGMWCKAWHENAHVLLRFEIHGELLRCRYAARPIEGLHPAKNSQGVGIASAC